MSSISSTLSSPNATFKNYAYGPKILSSQLLEELVKEISIANLCLYDVITAPKNTVIWNEQQKREAYDLISEKLASMKMLSRQEVGISCPCTKFTTKRAKSDLLEHLKIRHFKIIDKTFTCQECDASFIRARSLQSHTNTLHKQSNETIEKKPKKELEEILKEIPLDPQGEITLYDVVKRRGCMEGDEAKKNRIYDLFKEKLENTALACVKGCYAPCPCGELKKVGHKRALLEHINAKHIKSPGGKIQCVNCSECFYQTPALDDHMRNWHNSKNIEQQHPTPTTNSNTYTALSLENAPFLANSQNLLPVDLDTLESPSPEACNIDEIVNGFFAEDF